jgi:hypothetical protein
MITSIDKSILPGCTVLPPRDAANGEPIRHQRALDKAMGKRNRRGRGDRFGVLNAFVDFTMKELSRSEALVWLVLFRDTKRDGLARTSQADLARRAGMNDRTVRRAIDRLQERGLLDVVQRGGLRRGPSSYRVRGVK